jgi:peptidoglycan/LPS O-acetylase OafA/YrhL
MTEGPVGLPRRHEIDALRSIALVLLIAYHVLAAYQPFAKAIEFIPSPTLLEEIWFIGELMNSWRIPVLFLLSGLTAGYLLQNRSVRSLLRSRLLRLVPPMVLTFFIIAPISGVIFRGYLEQAFLWIPNPGHLWFVWNLVAYFILSVPLFHLLNKDPDQWLLRIGRAMHPVCWIPVFSVVLALVTWVMEPLAHGELYSAHFLRFWSGLICFLAGVFLVSLGEAFWSGIRRVFAPALILFLALYFSRMLELAASASWSFLPRVLESVCGMLAFLGLGSVFFTRPTRAFAAFNRAVFPVYIVHIPVQQGLAFVLFPMDWNIWLVFGLHVIGTLALSVLIYRMILHPLPWLHLWFGMASKPKRDPSRPPAFGETLPPVPWQKKTGEVMALYVIAPLITLAGLAGAVYLTATTFGVTEEEVQQIIDEEMEASGNPTSEPN